MAYINILSTTESSIRCNVAGLSTDYSYTDRECTWYLDGAKKGTSSLGKNISSGGAFTFSGLSAGTSYDIVVVIEFTEHPSYANVRLEETVETESASSAAPDPWDWFSSNGNASASLTRSSYYALQDKDETISFSRIVWNDMCDKIVEVREYLGFSSWNNTYGTYEDTKMGYYDRTLTAKRFNALRYNVDTAIDAAGLGNSQKTKINIVKSGQPVYARYFTTITDCINKLI